MRIWALFFGIVILGAQVHFCADLTSAPTTSHICPVCNAAGSALLSALPPMAVMPTSEWLETAAVPIQVSIDIPRDISPRAPPAL